MADLPIPVRTQILRAIRCAWTGLRDELGSSLLEMDEDTLTTHLWLRLNDMLDAPSDEVPGFSSDMFQHVGRDSKTITSDGGSYKQMPDLTFRLCGPAWKVDQALFCECKVVWPERDDLRENYCRKGLLRFVEGRYAWAVRFGLMIGFSRDGACVADHLLPILRDYRASERDLWKTLHVDAGDIGLDLHVSAHSREGVLSPDGSALEPITLGHLWLDVGS